MKNLYALSKKYLMSALFLAFLGAFFVSCFSTFAVRVKREIMNRVNTGGVSASIVKILDDSIPFRQQLINLNGGMYKLLGRRCINERYLLDDGQLTYVVPPMDVSAFAEETIVFRDMLQQEGIPFAYVNLPFKVNPHDKGLPVGVEDSSNENADAFLKILKDNGVDCLDIRQKIFEQGLSYTDLFLSADHHWKPEAGFWASGEIVQYLSMLDSEFNVNPEILKAESYSFKVYPKAFGGTAYARVGGLYASKSDLTIIEPTFDTQLTLTASALDKKRPAPITKRS